MDNLTIFNGRSYIYIYFRPLFLTPLFVLQTKDFNRYFTVKCKLSVTGKFMRDTGVTQQIFSKVQRRGGEEVKRRGGEEGSRG